MALEDRSSYLLVGFTVKIMFEKATESENVVVFTHEPVGTLIIDRTQWERNLNSPTIVTITIEPGNRLRT